MRSLAAIFLMAGLMMVISCQENSSGNIKKNNDSVHSGLEGTREDASQLSNATVDTSAGQSAKKAGANRNDSLARPDKDSLPIK